MEDEMISNSENALRIRALEFALAAVLRVACNDDEKRLIIAALRDAEDMMYRDNAPDFGRELGDVRRSLSRSAAIDEAMLLERALRDGSQDPKPPHDPADAG